MNPKLPISVTLLIKNGERHLVPVLDALKHFDEIILYDTGSEDRTLEIAKQFSNAVIYEKPFEGFGKSHNEATKLAKHDWILSIDADEVLSEPLQKEIASLTLNPNTVYALRFHNYFNQKLIKGCGWYPEKHIRLYHRQQTAFSEDPVHERVLSELLQVVTLKNPVNHFSYTNISDFLVKMERYSTLFAMQYKHKRKSSPWKAIYHGLGAFLKGYLLKRGFLDGYEGLLICFYNGETAFYKYLKLYHANQD